ncbi:uncharacterized protein BDZ99DRAFT_514062 [Mytilinidion resinicola]|uniref:Uncharacterized protein n=1 Tax=Mytilinidion resinicola TaxID=574789 RepID=A0A6A6ZAI5_9PEZI|nr:uncharacterized protein BDZ99DRAFT_514062 [Mytilinidion resinicola]KAF2817848.1 hypothetical protein BDZ99DRAFT_514062 [Mytilinidion resinicola]
MQRTIRIVPTLSSVNGSRDKEDEIPEDVDRKVEWGYKVYAGTGDRKGPSIHLQGCILKNPVVDILTERSVPQGTLALANMITATKVYAPFARGVFLKNHCNMNGADTEYLEGSVKTMVNMVAQPREIISPPAQHEEETRSLSDGNTWTMTLDLKGIKPPTILDSVTDAKRFLVRAQSECFSRQDYSTRASHTALLLRLAFGLRRDSV